MARRAQRQVNAKKSRNALPSVPTIEFWNPPPLDECDVTVSHIEPDLTTRITTKLVRWHDQLVDYAIVHSRLGADGWQVVSCIDCCHGYFHRHTGVHEGRDSELIRPIRAQVDVQYSYDASFDEIYDSYYKGREQP